MYHHRYQPQTSHLANRNTNAFASNNHRSNSSQSRANAQVTSELGLRASNPSNSIASPYQNHNRSGFGNHHKTGVNSIYHSGAYSSQPRQFAEERQDVIFRRVRGILNKITPETFDKLSKELVNVGLDSPRTLRGLIYLLFDKALKDLKYSSLYAKLCQELSERAPNFEQEPGPNTFCKFLISKCEDEFERRRKATEDFDGKNELTDEEFEQKTVAKQKMLGNIKFICELGKKRLLQEEILHECIRGLLSKKKERPLQDQAQDLECLCQIMRTIGSLLDIDASRNLMNQYFERIDMYSRKPELPSRIRFMLRDVIDLRVNKWRPRPFQKEDNVPQPLSKLREEAGFSNSPATASLDKIGNTKNLLNMGDLSKMHGGKLSSLLLDDDGPSFTTSTDFHWGSNTFLPNETEYDIFSSTMPAYNKIGTSTNSSSTTKEYPDSTTAVSNYLPSSDHITPISTSTRLAQAKPENYINNNNNNSMSSMHGRIDPFSDSFKMGKHNRLQTSRDMFGPQHINRDDSRHVGGAHALDRRNQVRDIIPSHPSIRSTIDNKRNDFESAIAHHDRDSFTNRQFQSNNIAHNHVQSDHRFMSASRDNRFEQTPRRPMMDERPRQLPPPQPRDDILTPVLRITNLPRHNDDIPPAPHQSVIGNAQVLSNQPNKMRNPRQVLEMSQRPQPETRNMHEAPISTSSIRDVRRFEREPRQPKFSGANYRLPGRPNKNQPVVPVRSNQPPESELNMNWRAAGAPSATGEAIKELNLDIKMPNNKPEPIKNSGSQSNLNTLNHRPVESMNESRPIIKRIDKESDNFQHEVNQFGNGMQNRRVHNLPHADKLVSESQSLSPPMSVANNISHQRNNAQNHSPKFDNMRPSDRSSTNEVSQLNHHGGRHQQNNHGPRTMQHDNNDTNSNKIQSGNRTSSNERDQNTQRRIPPDGDNRRQPPHRPRENFDSRNYRPAFGRNQSFETKTPQDLDRVQDWRKDIPQPHIRKENTPLAPSLIGNPLLAKPPTRMSETDFSLRPSHNLVGRALPEAATQSTSNSNAIPTPEKQTSKAITETPKFAPASRPQVDGSLTSKLNAIKDKVDATPGVFLENAASEFHVKKFIASISQYSSMNPLEASKIAPKINKLKIPKSYQPECLVSAMKQSIIGSESDRESTSKLLCGLVPFTFEGASLLKAFKIIFEQLNDLEAETPKVKSLVADLLSRAVFDNLLALDEVAGVLTGGKHHPLFLLLLQKLEKRGGQAWLSEKFIASKVNLMDMLPEVDRSKERLASTLKDRCLGFLDPMLTIEPDLWAQMKNNDPSPAAVYRWIKENVDQTIQGTPMFAHVFIVCLLRYIYNTAAEQYKSLNIISDQPEGSDSENSNKSSPTNAYTQAIGKLESELLTKYQQILQAILKDKQMQLVTLHALQKFYHELDFPKGALLRWFNMLYDMSIVDDDVFFIWKEEINDTVPGKGQALFQVNTWLNWLAEPDSEEEEES